MAASTTWTSRAASPLVRVIQVSPNLTFEAGSQRWAYNTGDAHYTWLSNAIDSGRAAGAKWIIVSAHKPCWGVGSHTCPTDSNFYDLVISKRVDLVLHGHEHGYMRSKQLTSGTSQCPTVPVAAYDADCVSGTGSSFTAGKGTVFATVGTGGITLANVNASDPDAGYFEKTSGLNSNPAFGFLDIHAEEDRLTANFINTLTNVYPNSGFTDSFTITQGGGNQRPTAAFTTATTDRTVNVNGSTSSDPEDGSAIASYAWNFGDGGTGTGATASHTYTTAGTYPVTLTVTDSGGLTGTTSKQVTVGSVAPSALATDTFSRTVASGFGATNPGGTWTVGGTSGYSVAEDTGGRMAQVPGGSRSAVLRSVSGLSVDATVALGYSGAITGTGVYAAFSPRWMPNNQSYRVKVRLEPSNTAKISLVQVATNGAETTIGTTTTSLAGMSTSRRILVRVQATGASPTVLAAKMWFEDTAEPAAWMVQATDNTAGLQGAGAPGMHTYLSSSAAATALSILWDDLSVLPK